MEEKIRESIQELIDQVCRQLNERYERQFAVSSVNASAGADSLQLILYQQEEPDVCFTAWTDSSGELRDTYVPNLVLRDLQRAVEAALSGTIVNAVLPWVEGQETDTGLSLAEYLRKHENHRILVRLLIQKECRPEGNSLASVLQDASRFFDTDLVVQVYVMEGDGYSRAKQMFTSLPTVSDTLLEQLEPLIHFAFYIKGGVSTTKTEEIAHLLEGEEQ